MLDDRQATREAGTAASGPRVDVLGVGISVTSLDDVVAKVDGWIEQGEQSYVCVTGVHGVMESQHDRRLMDIQNASGLTVPDGVPMVWCGRYAGAHEIDQVRGADLTLAICKGAARKGWSSFFYGGGPGVAELLAQRLSAQFPRLSVAGTLTPPFRSLSKEEDEEIVTRINESGADIVWVGLSTPRQERWMADHMGKLKPSVLIGIGAAFDMHAGLLKQAPPLLRRLGLEWLYRLAQDPRRLWRRYLLNNPRFVLRVLQRRPALR